MLFAFSLLFSLFRAFHFRFNADEREPIEMSAAACLNTNCDQMIHFEENIKLPMNCSKCDQLITEKHHQMYRDVTHATRMHLDKMKMSNIACKFIDPTKVMNFFTKIKSRSVLDLDICSVLIHKQTGFLHQMNIYRLKTLDLAFESAIDVGKWDEALRYGNELIPGFR